MAHPDNELIVTDDGSHSYKSHRFDVPYHSFHGAIQESRHVFMDAGLDFLMDTPGFEHANILEMGFGTGLNAALVLAFAQGKPEKTFSYYSFEKYPLSTAEVANLNYPTKIELDSEIFAGLHRAPFNGAVYPVTPNFNFAKSSRDFMDGLPTEWSGVPFNLLFYDAFAPASQPELWTVDALKICYDALEPGGIFVTYCAKGQFKRDLKAVGFTVEPLPGPPGKREMTRAIK